MATIKLKNGTGAPLASDLVQGEPALDLTNKRLYTEDAGGAIIEVGVNPTELNVTNNIVVGGTVDGRDIATDGTKLDTVETNADVTDTANVTAAGAVMDSELTSEASVKALNQGIATTDSPTFAGLTTTADVSFGDNDKAIFGAGSDLKIYHDGSASYIADTGTGTLNIKASGSIRLRGNDTDELLARFNENGSNQFYYDSAEKLATTSSGIDVTGTVTADGLVLDSANSTINTTAEAIRLDVPGDMQFDSRGSFKFNLDTNNNGTGSAFFIAADANKDNLNFKAAENGDISFYDTAGTDAKLFWDASAESLGIGTTSFASALSVATNGGSWTTSSSDGVGINYNSGNANISTYLDNSTLKIGAGVTQKNGITIYGQTGGNRVTFDVAGSERMHIDSSGNVGIGTDSPATTLDVAGEALIQGRLQVTSSAPEVLFSVPSGGLDSRIHNDGTGNFIFGTGTNSTTPTERMRIDSNGNVGIGTSSPSATLALDKNTTTQHRALDLENNNITYSMYVDQDNSSTNSWSLFDTTNSQTALRYLPSSSGYWQFYTNNTEAMRIDSSGNVGIGTDSPVSELDVAGTTPTLTIKDTQNKSWTSSDTTLGELAFRTSDTSGIGAHNVAFVRAVNEIASGTTPSGALSFGVSTSNTNASEAMRIDSSGNLLVGTTNTAPASSGNVAGSSLLAIGKAEHSRDGGVVLALNRKTSDGDIVDFRKDGTTVGSIGSVAGTNLSVTSDDGVLYLGGDQSGSVRAINNLGSGQPRLDARNDATTDLGSSSNRFKDLYLSGGAYLGGTAAANKLDDYEEGTWTPAIDRATTAPTITYTIQAGSYTKIGRTVHVTGYVGWSANSGGSGSFRITGLPFSVLSGIANYSTMNTIDYDGVTFAGNSATFGGYGATGDTYILLINGKNDGSSSVAVGGLAASGFIYFDMTYNA